MSWKYSAPYLTRELSSSRDASGQNKFDKFGLTVPSKFGTDRQSRWSISNSSQDSSRTFRVNSQQTEQSPVRTKASVSENSSSVVQRLKGKYSSADTSNSERNDLLNSYSRRPYGRSLSTLSVGNNSFKSKPASYEAENKKEYNFVKNTLQDGKPSGLRLNVNNSLTSQQSKTSKGNDKSPETEKYPVCDSRYRRADSAQNFGAETKIYSPTSPVTSYSSRFPSSASIDRNLKATKDKTDECIGCQQEDNKNSNEGELVTVVARGTSPSQTSSSIYLRSRRADFGIEKKIHRPKIKPPFSHKETQTEKLEELHSSRYIFSDINARIKPWSNYVDKYSSGTSSFNTIPRFSSRASYKSDMSKDSTNIKSPTRIEISGLNLTPNTANNYRNSLSRESSMTESKSPDSLPNSPASNVESPVAAKNICENAKQNEVHLTAKPPASFRSTETIKLSVQKPLSPSKEGDKAGPLRKSPSLSEDQATSPTHKNIRKIPSPNIKQPPEMDTTKPMFRSKPVENSSKPATNALPQEPKVSLVNGNSCLGAQKSTGIADSNVNLSVVDNSSASESSSEDETSSSDEEVERIKASETSFIKKSITNFLQNIPNVPPRKQPTNSDLVNRSKSGAFQKLGCLLGPTPKITFNRIESGERAWWLEGSEAPEGVIKILSNCCLSKQEQSNDMQGNEKPTASGSGNVEKYESNKLIANNNNVQPNFSSLSSDSNTNNCLTTPYLINRQFTTDLNWLSNSQDDLTKCNEGAVTAEENWNLDGNNNRKMYQDQIDTINGDTCMDVFPNRIKLSRKNCINSSEGDNVRSSWLSHNFCTNTDKYLQNFKNDVAHSESSKVMQDDKEENIDVTPGLRRRREQNRGKSPESNHNQVFPEIQTKKNQSSDSVGDFEKQTDMRDRTQSVVHQNGVASPVEEKNFELGVMSGMISKAKAGLAKSKTKLDVRKSSSREMSPKVTDHGKNEIDLYWMELVNSINRPLKLCDLDFTDLNTDDDTDVFGYHKNNGEIPPPPPMLILPPANGLDLKVPIPPTSLNPLANKNSKAPPPPPIVQTMKNKKTVKLFWKEIKDEPAPPTKLPGMSIIWDELMKVQVDTQKLEHLFESRAKDLITKKQQEQNKSKEIIVLDHKRSNAINIGMTKLPPPRAIKTAILKMDSTVVNKEGIEKLLTMLPTEEEKLRIQDAQSSNPELPLGSAEQFLLILASISELEARLKLWAFKLDFENSEKEICEPLMDLKQGIEILRSNKTFRAILSTLLSIGNFLNGCDVKGFQIEYLSKVPEVKDTVHKHSLLHHLCAIVMEKFPDSTDLYSEIGSVTRASKVDFEELAGNIKKIEEECKLSWNYLKIIAKHEGHTAMKVKMSDFLADCAERIIVLSIVHKRIISRFHRFTFWLGVPINRISIARPNEIFKIISEFALEYRTTRERILQQLKKMNHREKSRSRGYLSGDSNDGSRKMNSKEARDDAKLRQILGNDSTCPDNTNQYASWRRHRKEQRNLLDAGNNNDDEIIETLIKTANQIPSHRPSMKERRKSSRIIDRTC